MTVVLHRGGNIQTFQENSYEIITDFFRNFDTYKNKYNGIEIDIVELVDNDFVLMHSAKDSERLTGKKINLIKLKRKDINLVKIQKNIVNESDDKLVYNYDNEASFIFLDKVFDMYSKHKDKQEITLVLDFKSISYKGCTKLKELIIEYDIPNNNLILSNSNIFSVYAISKILPNIDKEWTCILGNVYTQLPYALEYMYCYILSILLKNWNVYAISLQVDVKLEKKMFFYNNNYNLSFFGLNYEDIMKRQDELSKYKVRYYCVDYNN